ncbi:hypothetical protein RCL1_004495 [Eukaryota sp. TZLM3-RCL]
MSTTSTDTTTTKVTCKWRDGNYYRAEILASDTRNSKVSYYVHYLDFNRRLDDWVDESAIDWSGSKSVSAVPLEVQYTSGPLTRSSRRPGTEEPEKTAPPELCLYEKERIERTKFKNVMQIQLGRFVIDTWYFSPYPEDYTPIDRLFICEFCLKYFKCKFSLIRHSLKCSLQRPPGDEIYRSQDEHISLYEINGSIQRLYCQNLCLLAKLFLDHKTLHFDVDPFLFYVLTENDESGAHIVGYFSKEKSSKDGYNLACILTLPCYQKKGYGNLLIQFSYELTKIEGKTGSPEKPLSDLGYVSYRSYWRWVLLTVLTQSEGPFSINQLSKMTGITEEDVTKTLQTLNLVRYYKGSHLLVITPEIVESHLSRNREPKIKVDPKRIKWSPLVVKEE